MHNSISRQAHLKATAASTSRRNKAFRRFTSRQPSTARAPLRPGTSTGRSLPRLCVAHKRKPQRYDCAECIVSGIGHHGGFCFLLQRFYIVHFHAFHVSIYQNRSQLYAATQIQTILLDIITCLGTDREIILHAFKTRMIIFYRRNGKSRGLPSGGTVGAAEYIGTG